MDFVAPGKDMAKRFPEIRRAVPDFRQRCAVARWMGLDYLPGERILNGPRMDLTSLVVVGTFVNFFDAEIAKSALDAAGIDAIIRADDAGGMRPHLWMSGVQLLVRSDDADEALDLLTPEG